MNTKSSIAIALGMVLGATILAWGLMQARSQSNFVTVKGLSEREVIADRAWFSVNTQIAANSTAEMQQNIARIEGDIKSFLKRHGFSEEEINSPSLNVYQNSHRDAASRLNGDFKMSVSTSDISKVQKAIKSTGDLVSQGILLQSDQWSSGPKYYFTKFKEIKKEMLAEATHEAKAAAREFANNSGSVVGKIRRANQGVFQILPGDRSQDNEVFQASKIIRVVSTIDYYLE